ncbi:MAG: agmatine deiminase family protein [Alphaproteobacteria bacterium]|nr:agmatine deiminase family protein [Alphaproteobacteria bacterium]
MTEPTDALSRYPAESGFAWPAEWKAHRRTWMCWPSRLECFGDPGRFLRGKHALAHLARTVAGVEPVTLAVRAEDAAEARLATAGKAEIVEMPLDDGWARDIGPTFLLGSENALAGVQWNFNAWGHKYQPYAHDAMFARHVMRAIGAREFAAPLVCEGGALHGDGEGTILITEQCLLNANRNPGLARADIEKILGLYLGARKVIWLQGRFSDLETDGHIDNIACFAAPGRVILGMPDLREHPDWEPVQDAMRTLSNSRDARGRRLEIIPLPQPGQRRLSWSGQLLQASYVNFYLANRAVIMPAFDDPHDDNARDLAGSLFPDRKVLQINALDLVQGGGGIHCMTQQEPAP